MARESVAAILHYHDETKHGFRRFARSPGHLDWPNEPFPFRRFTGTEIVSLTRNLTESGPTWGELKRSTVEPAPLTLANLGNLFYHSLALSAWKQVVDPQGRVVSRWSLRVDPSSGNLHPTECYLIGGLDGELAPGILHYAPDIHALEWRGTTEPAAWAALQATMPGGLLLALTSIQWREIWKYGERAYRYCQHDAGHVLATLSLAAARLGWRARLLPHPGTDRLARLLGTDRQSGPEAEHADCLVLLTATDNNGPGPAPADLEAFAGATTWHGEPNDLSPEHRYWSIIDSVNAATVVAEAEDRYGGNVAPTKSPSCDGETNGASTPSSVLIRRRRSAQAMDPRASMPIADFHRLLAGLVPGANAAVDHLLPWPPCISLAIFVHRVEGLARGLYLLARSPDHVAALRQNCRPDFAWERPDHCPADLPLYLLKADDVRRTAQLLSCNQAIAGDGVFSLGMLADFDATLVRKGAAVYPRLFWETGVIGQLLYLEAEAAGRQGTGIGCFFDDDVHDLLGISSHAWQSLYHFTVGQALLDERLQTVAAYDHLDVDATPSTD